MMGGEFATSRRLGVADVRYIHQKRSEGVGVDNIARMAGVSPEDVRRIAPSGPTRQTPAFVDTRKRRIADPIATIAREADDLDDIALRRAVGLLAGMVSAREGAAGADAVLESISGANRRAAKPTQAIIQDVASAYGFTADDILSNNLNRTLTPARHAAYFEVRRQRPWLSLPQIGRVFRRDHSTILYGIRRHATRIGEVLA